MTSTILTPAINSTLSTSFTSKPSSSSSYSHRFDHFHCLQLLQIKPLIQAGASAAASGAGAAAVGRSSLNNNAVSMDILHSVTHSVQLHGIEESTVKKINGNLSYNTSSKLEEEKEQSATGAAASSINESEYRMEILNAFQTCYTSMLNHLKAEYGKAVTVTAVNNSEYLVQMPSHQQAAAGTQWKLQHRFLSRPLPTKAKLDEGNSKLVFALSHTSNAVATAGGGGNGHGHAMDPVIRLDYLQLNESLLPTNIDEFKNSSNLLHCKSVNLSHNYFTTLPSLFTITFSHIHSLNLSHNSMLFSLPSSISDFKVLTVLDLTDCSNLISLPSSLAKLRQTLKELRLFGCTALSSPPHSVAVRTGLAIQTDQACHPVAVQAMLDYMLDPAALNNWSLHDAKKKYEEEGKNRSKQARLAAIEMRAPGARTAYGMNYIEYEFRVGYKYTSWTVYKRWSQFKSFYNDLNTHLPASFLATLQPLPGKTWSLHETDKQIVETRRQFIDSICVQLNEWDLKNLKSKTDTTKKGAAAAAGGQKEGLKGLEEMAFVQVFLELSQAAE